VFMLALVAIGATSGGGAAGHGNAVHPPPVVVSVGVVAFTAVMVVSILLLGYQLLAALAQRPPSERPKKRPWWVYLLVIALFASVRYGVAFLVRVFGSRHGVSSATSGAAHAVPKLPPLPKVANPPPAASLLDVVVGVLIGVAVLAAGVVMARRSAKRGAAPVSGAGVAGSALGGAEMVEESIDALQREPDPRRAVIAAYRSMDRWLDRAGLGREPWEAPFEHLARVLAGLGGTAPVARRLAGLFERAKFDQRPCGPEMKDEALAALTLLRESIVVGQATRNDPGTSYAGDPTAQAVGTRAAL
jgi:hypothetical protein